MPTGFTRHEDFLLKVVCTRATDLPRKQRLFVHTLVEASAQDVLFHSASPSLRPSPPHTSSSSSLSSSSLSSSSSSSSLSSSSSSSFSCADTPPEPLARKAEEVLRRTEGEGGGDSRAEVRRRLENSECQRRLVDTIKSALDEKLFAHWHVFFCGVDVGYAVKYRKGTLGLFTLTVPYLISRDGFIRGEEEETAKQPLNTRYILMVYKSPRFEWSLKKKKEEEEDSRKIHLASPLELVREGRTTNNRFLTDDEMRSTDNKRRGSRSSMAKSDDGFERLLMPSSYVVASVNDKETTEATDDGNTIIKKPSSSSSLLTLSEQKQTDTCRSVLQQLAILTSFYHCASPLHETASPDPKVFSSSEACRLMIDSVFEVLSLSAKEEGERIRDKEVLARSLREKLTEALGPIWHVIVGESFTVSTFATTTTSPSPPSLDSASASSDIAFLSAEVRKGEYSGLKLICFKHSQLEKRSSVLHFFFKSAVSVTPIVSVCLLSVFFIVRNKLCRPLLCSLPLSASPSFSSSSFSSFSSSNQSSMQQQQTHENEFPAFLSRTKMRVCKALFVSNSLLIYFLVLLFTVSVVLKHLVYRKRRDQ